MCFFVSLGRVLRVASEMEVELLGNWVGRGLWGRRGEDVEKGMEGIGGRSVLRIKDGEVRRCDASENKN